MPLRLNGFAVALDTEERRGGKKEGIFSGGHFSEGEGGGHRKETAGDSLLLPISYRLHRGCSPYLKLHSVFDYFEY